MTEIFKCAAFLCKKLKLELEEKIIANEVQQLRSQIANMYCRPFIRFDAIKI